MRRMEQYFPVRWTNHSQVIRFQGSRKNTKSNRGLFYLCLRAFLRLLDDSEVEINDVLGEGNNLTLIVRIKKESATRVRVQSLSNDWRAVDSSGYAHI